MNVGSKIKNIPQRAKRQLNLPKWYICTEGATEANYIKEYAKTLGLADRIVTCSRPGCCGRKHVEMIQQVTKCMRNKITDQVWIVYDFDEADDDPPCFSSFCEAFSLAHDANYHVVVNVPCFEYWLLLHFKDQCTAYWRWTECQKHFLDKINEVRRKQKKPLYHGEQHKNDPDLYKQVSSLSGGGVEEAIKHAVALFDNDGIKLNSKTINIEEIEKLSKNEAKKLFNKKNGACLPCSTMPVLLEALKTLATK